MSLPPLVDPAPSLTPPQRTRYARHLLLPQLGPQGQGRLRAASVLVVGAGGLGSPVLTYLAAAGVGSLTVVDDDLVDESNLQRQFLHGDADVGARKVDSALASLRRIAPWTTLTAVPERLTRQNATRLLAGHHLVVDGSDNFPTRYLVNDAAVAAGIPLVWGSILALAGQVSVWWAEHGPCYRCVFPDPPPPGSVPSCGEAGVLGSVCGAIGSLMATQAIQLITGTGEPLVGRLLVHDAGTSAFDALTVRRNPDCPVCGSGRAGGPDAGPGEIGAGAPGAQATAPGNASADRHVAAGGGIPQIDATGLAELLAGPHPPIVIDVRPEPERAIAALPSFVAIHLDDFRSGAAFDHPALADRSAPVILVCRSGARSAEATWLARVAGYHNAVNLHGGVLGWARDVDPTLPTY